MGFYTPDVYSQPEKLGIELIGTIDLSEPDYSFDVFGVWKRLKDDGLFEYGWLTDAGCSCPSPFEDYTSANDIRWVDKPFALIQGLEQTLEEGYYTTAEKEASRDALIGIIFRIGAPSAV